MCRFVVYFYLIVKNENSLQRPEFSMVILISTIGMMLMVSSNDLLSLFVSLELQSLALYILVSFSKEDFNSSEAGVKYFVIGSLSTCIFLFGASLIYGLVGSTNFSEISQFMSDQYSVPLLPSCRINFYPCIFIFKNFRCPFICGLLMYIKDHHQLLTAFLSTAPKVAILVF